MDISPDETLVEAITRRIEECGGYCPCNPEKHGDPDYYCPCIDLFEKGECCCGLYV